MGLCEYLLKLEESKVNLAIAMFLEPTMETINKMESTVRKGTGLEVILMKLKYITTRYNKARKRKVMTHCMKPLMSSTMLGKEVTST